MIAGPFYTSLYTYSSSAETLLFVVFVCLSVCHIPHLTFVHSIVERLNVRKFTFFRGNYPHASDWWCNSKIKRPFSLGTKTARIVFRSYFRQSGSIYVKHRRNDRRSLYTSLNTFRQRIRIDICPFLKIVFLLIAQTRIARFRLVWHTDSTPLILPPDCQKFRVCR